MTPMTRREIITAGFASMPLICAAMTYGQGSDATVDPIGPLLGHVDHEVAMIWYRPSTPGKYFARIVEKESRVTRELSAMSAAENDLCVLWRFESLKADTEYEYRIVHGGKVVASGPDHRFRTAPLHATAAKTVLTMGSCASSTQWFDIWARMESMQPHGLVLLGDTPYIDSSSLKVNRDKHRQFIAIPTLVKMATHTPMWGTWDDHDFGANDSDGKVKEKHIIRKVFTEYRAHTNYGDGEQGIYTRFRRGPVEVFLIDPRYFAQTEPSPANPQKPTCLGKKQWNWLLDSLKASTAPFKILATGMIWDDKKNKEKDDWETYAHEREALFDFIGEHKITGVILLGGDIHVSRHLRYPMTNRIGYDLHQFIISPLHERVIPSLNVPHPNLLWGEPLPNMFLHLECDNTMSPATLRATWIDRVGKTHHQVNLTATDLSAAN